MLRLLHTSTAVAPILQPLVAQLLDRKQAPKKLWEGIAAQTLAGTHELLQDGILEQLKPVEDLFRGAGLNTGDPVVAHCLELLREQLVVPQSAEPSPKRNNRRKHRARRGNTAKESVTGKCGMASHLGRACASRRGRSNPPPLPPPRGLTPRVPGRLLPPPPPPRGLRPTVRCQRCRTQESMGTKGTRRKF